MASTAQLGFHMVNTLPTTRVPRNFYMVLNGDYVETYLTDQIGTPKMVGNSQMINDIISARLADQNIIEVFETYAEFITFAQTATKNFLGLVADASLDPTVDAGSAMYAYRESDQSIYKVYEMESLDLVIDWGSIQNRPQSTVQQIDDAVTKAHEHNDLITLNKITKDVNNRLTYDGDRVNIPDWESAEW